MNPTCPIGSQLYQGLCYGRCPLNTAPANEDPTKCVSSATCSSYVPSAPYALMSDAVFDLVCNKIPAEEVSGACPVGYTAWQTGSCFVNCPGSLLENGLTCLKKPVQRPYTSPECSAMYYFNGQSCTLSMNAYFLIFVIFVGFLWYLWPKPDF